MNILKLVLSGLMKKGVLYEGKKVDIDVKLPDSNVTINIKAERMLVRVFNENKTVFLGGIKDDEK